MFNNLQTELSKNTDNGTANMSDSRDKMKELQKAIANAQALTTSIPLNDLTDLRDKIMIKDAVNKLESVQKMVLESKKSRLRSLQIEPRVEEIQNVVMKSNNNSTFAMPKVQRSYKLTSKTSFEVWLDSLKTELTSWSLLDLIDSKLSGPSGLSEADIILRKNSVKDIINHIDEDYHKKILGLTEPMEILNKLRDSRRGEVSSTPTSIRTKLYNLRMNKRERAHDFCERFDHY